MQPMYTEENEKQTFTLEMGKISKMNELSVLKSFREQNKTNTRELKGIRK